MVGWLANASGEGGACADSVAGAAPSTWCSRSCGKWTKPAGHGLKSSAAQNLWVRLQSEDEMTKRTPEERLRAVAQILIAEIGADGPMDAEDAAAKAVQTICNLRDWQGEVVL